MGIEDKCVVQPVNRKVLRRVCDLGVSLSPLPSLLALPGRAFLLSPPPQARPSLGELQRKYPKQRQQPQLERTLLERTRGEADADENSTHA